ncbi:MAG: flagellar biosynthesis anti-sigma factor FlgM [bacterium]|nr:flagellar biosynthesis anti-sigma factor FlgM [bacterium]
MFVDPIRKIKEIIKPAETVKKNTVERESPGIDVVHISSEAKNLLKEEKIRNKVKAIPDIRMEKVEEAKEKLAQGVYLQKAIAEKIAEKLADRIVKT